MNSALEELRWVKYHVLDDGFVTLVDAMGDDAAVVQAARVSYGAGTKRVSDDRSLIRYLMRNRHDSPFEMCNVKFLVRVPMDCWRQWIRHRTASVNEASTRYSIVTDSLHRSRAHEWRLQAKDNKQGSGDFIDPLIGRALTAAADLSADTAKLAYGELLGYGVAREQARKVLPLCTYTEAYWSCNLRNIFHFLGLRLDRHAQLEIRLYAGCIYDIVKQLFPICSEAFEDYHAARQGMTLSRSELAALGQLLRTLISADADVKRWQIEQSAAAAGWPADAKSRERDEYLTKISRIIGG